MPSHLMKPRFEISSKQRHAELVDKKFSASLLPNEQTELNRLEELLDEADAPHYEQTIKKLIETRDRLSSN